MPRIPHYQLGLPSGMTHKVITSIPKTTQKLLGELCAHNAKWCVDRLNPKNYVLKNASQGVVIDKLIKQEHKRITESKPTNITSNTLRIYADLIDTDKKVFMPLMALRSNQGDCSQVPLDTLKELSGIEDEQLFNTSLQRMTYRGVLERHLTSTGEYTYNISYAVINGDFV